MENLRRFSILCEPALIKRVKLLAIEERVSASELMRQAISDLLRNRREPATARGLIAGAPGHHARRG